MTKFLKYDFKGSFKTLLGFVLGGVVASTFLQVMLISGYGARMLPEILLALVALASVIIVVSVVVGFIIYSVRLFSNELNTDRGYLTFSVPRNMTQMILSKLTIVFVWSIISLLVGIFFNIGLQILLTGENFLDMFKMISRQEVTKEIIKTVIIIAIDATYTMSVCYFAISLSKVTFRNKKLGLMWLPIFIGLMIIISYLKSLIGAGYIQGINGSTLVDPIINNPIIQIRASNAGQTTGNYILAFVDILIGSLFVTLSGIILNKKINI